MRVSAGGHGTLMKLIWLIDADKAASGSANRRH
jgi:hypothetical protein